MNTVNWKDVGIRALKSAVQAALSIVSVAAVFEYVKPDAVDLSGLAALGLAAAVAAGTAAYAVVQNALLQWTQGS